MTPSELIAYIQQEPDENKIISFIESNPTEIPTVKELNSFKEKGKFFIYSLVETNKVAVVRKFLSLGCKANCKNGDINDSPLHLACRKNYLEMAQLLIAYKADVNATNSYGEKSLHLVAISGNQDFLDLLLVHGANPNLQDKSRKTPLEYAMISNKKAAVKKLIAGGTNLEKINLLPTGTSTEIYHKYLKHKLRQAGPIQKLSDAEAHTPAEILASVTYAENPILKSLIFNLYKILQANPIFSDIIQTMAVICLSEPKIGITLIHKPTLSEYLICNKGTNQCGNFNGKSSISVASDSISYSGTILHEIVHLVCHRVFNSLNPYYSDDLEAQFKLAVAMTLKNIHDSFPSIAIPSTIQVETSAQIAIGSENKSSWDLGQQLYSNTKYLTISNNNLAIIKFLGAYNSYQPHEEHSEIIVRYFQVKHMYDFDDFDLIFAPLKSYICSNFIPALRDFFKANPNREKVVINNSHDPINIVSHNIAGSYKPRILWTSKIEPKGKSKRQKLDDEHSIGYIN